jgi:hypothetical protein
MLTQEMALDRLRRACAWLTEVAQVRDEAMVDDAMRRRHAHQHWRGAIRGEYSVARQSWKFVCPIWHTGQAIKALVLASEHLGDGFMAGALLGGEFILANTVQDGPDRGLILAYEDHPDKLNVSAVLECVDGLLHLGRKTGQARFTDAALAAIQWVQDKALLGTTGLVLDLYDPRARQFVPQAYTVEGRPLLDDAAFLLAHRLSGREEFWQTARAIADRLLADEGPEGNWVCFPPCNKARGSIHPRHAYWWGRPMLAMYQHSGEARYREMFLRSCGWYTRALRRDGGLLRNTYTDFNTDSFGHATSGAAAALLMFLDRRDALGDASAQGDVDRVLNHLLGMQFIEVRDPNLAGCVLEKVLPPNGSDASPYHIRDLGTIFFVQALSQWLSAARR